MPRVKGNEESFGEATTIANGDCFQLPDITGCKIFLNRSFFAFDFNLQQKSSRFC